MRKIPEVSCEQQRRVEVLGLAFCSSYAKTVQNVLRESKWHSLRNFQHLSLHLLSSRVTYTPEETTFSNKQLKST